MLRAINDRKQRSSVGFNEERTAPARVVEGAAERPVLTILEAANHLRISRSKLYELMKAGALPYHRVGGRRRISRADIDAYLARHRVA